MSDHVTAGLDGVPLVDARAVRCSQGLVALLVVAAAAAGSPGILAAPALLLFLSAVLGRRGNLAVRAFDRLVRPRLSTADLEDARPPRFANSVGSVFLAASLLAHAGGVPVLGWALALAVAALASLSAATGFCVGCRMYWLVALLRRARAGVRGA